MNETIVTLAGHVGGDVSLRQAGEVPVASFRVASTPRRYQRRTDSWVDGATQWYTVTAWRGLADHVAASLRRGDPVVVHGRLTVSTWTGSSGQDMTTLEVEAQLVGHDLTRGTSVFTRTVRAGGEPAPGVAPTTGVQAASAAPTTAAAADPWGAPGPGSDVAA